MTEHKKNKASMDWPLISFVAGLGFIAFAVGGTLAVFDLQPFRYLKGVFALAPETIEQVREQRPSLLRKIQHTPSGAHARVPGPSLSGQLLMQGWFSDGPQVRLVNYAGEIQHQWKVDFFEIWPDPSHVYPSGRIPNSRFNFHTQGMHVEPDGSIVVSVGDLGAAKLDRCSNVVWTVDRATHHVVTSDGAGGFWMAANQDPRKIKPAHLFFGTTLQKIESGQSRYEDLLLHVDANGVVTQEFSVLQALLKTEFEHQLYDTFQIDKYDPTHINDIELVTPPLADKLDGVNAGDLLVSVRQLHALVIMDAVTGDIKWHQTGPWVRQHDPDILPNGNLRVFNNGGGRKLSFDRVAHSNIVEIDPQTRAWEIVVPITPDTSFATEIMGSYDALPDGSHLVAESRLGRVIQFAPDKSISWEYVEAYDDTHAALIEIAEWLPEDFFTVADWNCP